MNIQEQFDFIAKEYDKNRKKFIPCFDDFYINSTDFILSNISYKPKRIIDLGAGTGLLSACWYKYCPNSEFVLIDIAENMLDIAKERFSGLDNVSYQTMDYIDKLPEKDFDTAISALSIHHLEDESKKALFSRIYDRLPTGGMLVNYDQFCAGEPELNRWYDTYWEKQLDSSDLTENDIELWKERRTWDKECSVEKEVEMLKDCNFKSVKCIYSYRKFAVVMAIK
ncbi:MAG: methyltransferase domain-containing protein [Clostridiales bacterium]|nr:methyltransferase domain-containing protein [Clostridiales bacterium]